ncbi:MAG: hypothetical protein EOP49_09840 [Sphingobacteriales bacterium]|nr:MAG: hypothetical protein EOP49_09840 [Sphingobacteriales bacterium]
MKYLKKYRDYRKEQADQIRVTQNKIEKKLGILTVEKTQKDVLRSAEEQQRMVILRETNEKDQVVRELKGREKELSKEIEKNRKAARQVNVAIEKIIQREIELARKKAEEEERKRREEAARIAAANSNTGGVNVSTGSGTRPLTGPGSTGTSPSGSSRNSASGRTTTSGTVASAGSSTPARSTASYINNLTPEATALSNSFENNRGRLPWPVEKGVISIGFGPYKHPIEEKVTLENYGITISTNPGITARAIFEGTVSSSIFVAGAGWVVIINHGQFFSVYSGLANVSVRKDQKVNTKQALGVVGQNDEGSTILNFQIWKVGKNNQTAKLDPAQWIAR